VHDLIERRVDEVAELHFGHRAQSVERHPDRRADDAAFRERRVDDAVGPEFLVQAGGGAEDAAELPDVLTQHHHARIPAHLDAERIVDGLDDVPIGHGGSLLPATIQETANLRSSSTHRCPKNWPALYDERTRGPAATNLNPRARPSCSRSANTSGRTYSSTGKCFSLGRRYCPSVRMSHPAERRSRMAAMTSARSSPSPSMIEDFVRIPPRL